MDTQELLKYRLQLVHDAAGMVKRPERVPHVSGFYTWEILDAGYKLSEAIYDWDIMEKVVRAHQEKYNFDVCRNNGTRNPYRVIESLGPSKYVIDDEREIIAVADSILLEPEEYDMFINNYTEFLWTVAMPRRFNKLNSMEPKDFKPVIDRYLEYFGYAGKIGKIFKEEYGLPQGCQYMMRGSCHEYLFSYFRGIAGLSSDMRRYPEKVLAATEVINQHKLYPTMDKIRNGVSGPDLNRTEDIYLMMLSHVILNLKQWEKYYWNTYKDVIDLIVSKDKTAYVFAEGSVSRFYDYFRDVPKGHLMFHLEQDDIYEARKELPNCCLVGGMTTTLLGASSVNECVDEAKKLIDVIGRDGGFMLSQNKMMSYRNDAKPENLKAVCDFVLQYRG